MTTSSAPSPRPDRRRAFTLSEVLISVTVGAVLITLLMGMVVTHARLAVATGNYAEMNEENRRALTLFDNDMRAASDVLEMRDDYVRVSAITGLRAGVPKSDTIEYTYDPKAATFSRTVTDSVTGAKQTRTLITGVDTDVFNRSKNSSAKLGPLTYLNKDDQVVLTATDPGVTTVRILEVKKIMLNVKLKRGNSLLTNSDYVVSAVVVMRSRPVG